MGVLGRPDNNSMEKRLLGLALTALRARLRRGVEALGIFTSIASYANDG